MQGIYCPLAYCAPWVLRRAELGVRRNPVWRDSSNVKRERAVGNGYGIEGMGSDSGILLGIILYFCHFLFVLKGLTLEVDAEIDFGNILTYLYFVPNADTPTTGDSLEAFSCHSVEYRLAYLAPPLCIAVANEVFPFGDALVMA